MKALIKVDRRAKATLELTAETEAEALSLELLTNSDNFNIETFGPTKGASNEIAANESESARGD